MILHLNTSHWTLVTSLSDHIPQYKTWCRGLCQEIIYIYACAYCWRVYSKGLHTGLLLTINTYNQQVVSSINRNSTKVYMKPIEPAYTLFYYYILWLADWHSSGFLIINDITTYALSRTSFFKHNNLMEVYAELDWVLTFFIY